MKNSTILLVEMRNDALVFGMCNGLDKTSLEVIGAQLLRRFVQQGADVSEVLARYEALKDAKVTNRQVAVPLIVRGNNG